MKMLHLSWSRPEPSTRCTRTPFYDSLTQFMSSGPIVAMILEGENAIRVNRDLMGATDYRRLRPAPSGGFCPGHRGQHRPWVGRPRHRQHEIAFFFNSLEQV